EVPPDRAAALSRALDALAARGLRVIAEAVARDAGAEGGAGAGAARVMSLELIGLDRPGLVREISQRLAQHDVNVEELITDRASAPMSGEMMFRAEARVKVPASLDPERLRDRLERLALDLTIEIRLDEDVAR